jgi:hypothetical protein
LVSTDLQIFSGNCNHPVMSVSAIISRKFLRF